MDPKTVGPATARAESGRTMCRSNNYWSSSTNANNPDNAWNVNFHNGNANWNNKNNNNYVRCVRGEHENP